MRKTRRQHVLWVHYLEPHAPYQKHEGFDFGEGRDERYLSEVSFLDAELGRLLGALRSEGWYDDSLIVFFADHGQALGERGYYGHHVFLNGFITDIPFIMRTPDGSARPIEGSVSNIDVAPTVLHFLGVETAAQLTGQSLLVHDPAVDRSIVSEAFPIRGISLFQFANERLEGLHSLKARVQQIQEGDRRYLPKVSLVRYPYRLIVRRTTGTHELFDIARDPSERRDIAASEPKVAARMQKELAAWHTEQAQRFFCDLARAKAAKEATPTDEPPDVHPPGPTPKPPAAPKLPKTKGKSRL
jgi:arylsulfatase A-like enzyme